MSRLPTRKWDVTEYLKTPKDMAFYLEACLEEADGDAAFIARALGDVARAKGMTEVARESGLSRESLYKALSGERSPDFDTILKVVKAVGLSLHAQVGNKPRTRRASPSKTGAVKTPRPRSRATPRKRPGDAHRGS